MDNSSPNWLTAGITKVLVLGGVALLLGALSTAMVLGSAGSANSPLANAVKQPQGDGSPTATATFTETLTPSATATASATQTPESTQTATTTNTALPTGTSTATVPATSTATATVPAATNTVVPTMTGTPAATGTAERKVSLCHRTGSAKNPYVFITVSESAIPAHQRHGDIIPAPAGGCPAAPPQQESNPGKSTGNKQENKQPPGQDPNKDQGQGNDKNKGGEDGKDKGKGKDK